MVEKPPSRGRSAPMPPEPPLPEAPPPWWDPDEEARPVNQVTAVAAAATAKKNQLAVVPIESKKTQRPIKSRSYLALVEILSNPGRRQMVLGDARIELNEMGERVTVGRRPLTDVDVSRIRANIERAFAANKDGDGLKFTKADVLDAVRQVADDNRYHPVQEFLRSLSWDGKPRLERVAEDLLDIKDPAPIVKTILRKWFVSAVKRAMEPGCICKSMLILQGGQNAAKSTFFRVLASQPWFSDTAIDIHNKEAHVMLSSVWIQEWAELREMQGRTAEAVKNFISSPEGKFLPKYGNFMVERPRTSVIVGTTNEVQFLDDPSGNVRYHPLAVGNEIRLDLVAEQREQLWAEAVEIWSKHERFDSWLTSTEEERLRDHQAQFERPDVWEEDVLDFVERYIGHLTTSVIMSECLGIEKKNRGGREASRLGAILRKHGYAESGRPRVNDRRLRTWVKVTK